MHRKTPDLLSSANTPTASWKDAGVRAGPCYDNLPRATNPPTVELASEWARWVPEPREKQCGRT